MGEDRDLKEIIQFIANNSQYPSWVIKDILELEDSFYLDQPWIDDNKQ